MQRAKDNFFCFIKTVKLFSHSRVKMLQQKAALCSDNIPAAVLVTLLSQSKFCRKKIIKHE